MPEFESCPHCNGTGQRVIPPPPEPRPGFPAGGKRGVRRHGHVSTYQGRGGKNRTGDPEIDDGCRCDLCKAAWRKYVANRKSRAKETS